MFGFNALGRQVLAALRPPLWSRLRLSHLWLALGVLSLFVSGVFALFISAAKLPGAAQVLTQIDFFRRALVVHVDLSVVVWFMCVPVALLHFLFENAPSRLWLRFCFSAALAGVLLFAFAGFLPEGRPLLSNYIPVTTHPLYLLGLVWFLFMVALNYSTAFVLVPSNNHPELYWGIRLGCIYFLFGLFVLFSSVIQVPLNYRDEAFYEIGVWGYGHLQQFSNLVFMMISWILLLRSWNEKILPSRRMLGTVFLGLALPLLGIPFLLGYEPNEFAYRQGFTELMRWGTFPPCLLFLGVIGYRAIRKNSELVEWRDYRWISFFSSASLLVIGFIFGAFVRGPDLRLPGHYHATIGAVTLSFMGVAFILIDGLRKMKVSGKDPKRFWSPILYAVGQLGFSGGMFIAGSFGMGRKMYGVEQQFQNLGQQTGIIIMATGGVLALIGGFIFGLATLPSVFRPDRFQAPR